MSINSINTNLPKYKLPSLFDSPNTNKKTANPLKYTTESSLEETNKTTDKKNYQEKKAKQLRTSENWYG